MRKKPPLSVGGQQVRICPVRPGFVLGRIAGTALQRWLARCQSASASGIGASSHALEVQGHHSSHLPSRAAVPSAHRSKKAASSRAARAAAPSEMQQRAVYTEKDLATTHRLRARRRAAPQPSSTHPNPHRRHHCPAAPPGKLATLAAAEWQWRPPPRRHQLIRPSWTPSAPLSVLATALVSRGT